MKVQSLILCLVLLMLAGFLVFTGCTTEVGATGEPGPPGIWAGERTFAETCTVCHAAERIADVEEVHMETSTDTLEGAITGVIVDDTVSPAVTTITFSVTDQGVGKTDLSSSDVRFTVVQLVPPSEDDPATPGIDESGDTSYWQSLINDIDGSAIEADYEKGNVNTASGAFTHLGAGIYTYELAADIADTSGIPSYDYVSDRVTRVAMQISGGITQYVWDFNPSTDAKEAALARQIVTNVGSCNSCHEKLSNHGSREAIDYCVTCHNKGTLDSTGKSFVDMAVMTHKIHVDADYPLEIENTCTKCHVDLDVGVPDDSDNWSEAPTMESCGSCHDDVVFDTGVNHGPNDIGGDQATNSDCAGCHDKDGGWPVVDAHGKDPARVEAAEYVYTNLIIADTKPEDKPKITFQVADKDDLATPLVISDIFADNGAGISVLIGLGTEDDYSSNIGDNGDPITIKDYTINTAGDTYTFTSPTAIDKGATGSGIVAIQGHPYSRIDYNDDGVFEDRLAVKNVVKYFAIDDTPEVEEVKERREVVSIDKCNSCHDSLSIHGDNRTDSIETCVVCHNPDATDHPVRATGDEVTVDFKNMIHGIHAGGMRENDLVILGHGSRAHDYSDVRYPGNLGNCESCHLVITTYSHGQATSVGTQVLPLKDEVEPTKTSIEFGTHITPATSVCTSCHDSNDAINHSLQNGGAVDALESEIE